MALSLKDRLAQKQQQTPKTGLASRFGNKSAATSPLKQKLGGGGGGSSIRNRFQKRSASVLDKTWEDRNERSKGGSTGRPLFNQELMAQFGIEDFKTTVGDRFIEILPISFEANQAYFTEISVHFGVGFANDAFICMQRFNRQRCYRCERQAVMWRDQVTYTKDQAKALYPTDRAVYLLWERTKELIDGEEPDFTFQIWAAPKSKVHSEIQEKVRDKLHRHTLDISDVHEGGEGRTVGFTIVKQGDFPDYKAFDLIPRETPIPDEVLEKLASIVEYANEQGYTNALEVFYNLHEYDELKEAMETEEEMMDDQQSEAQHSNGPASRFNRPSLQSKATPQQQPPQQDPANDEEAIMQELETIQNELLLICNNPLKWRKWCNDNDYAAALEMDPTEAVSAIIDDMYEKAMADIRGPL